MPPQYQGEASSLLSCSRFPVTCTRQGVLQAGPRGCMAWLYSVGTSKDRLICPIRLGWGPRGSVGEGEPGG